jgi:hypothetical protein
LWFVGLAAGAVAAAAWMRRRRDIREEAEEGGRTGA